MTINIVLPILIINRNFIESEEIRATYTFSFHLRTVVTLLITVSLSIFKFKTILQYDIMALGISVLAFFSTMS